MGDVVDANVMVTGCCPIHQPPLAGVLLLTMAATTPGVAPGVQVTKNPTAEALVGLAQLPPDNVTTDVRGTLVPTTENCVGTPA